MTATTPRLSEVARHLTIPDGIVTSVFPRIYRHLTSAGVAFDPWQSGLGMAALGCRKDGKYAATVGGVTVSIPRQVGKTFTIGGLLIGLAIEFPGMRIVWTSQHSKTNMNTFRAMQGIVQRKALRSKIKTIRGSHGDEEIVFSNSSVIMFGAREFGFGRGMDAVDVMVFDEAQKLGIKALEDMIPATNRARHPHGALVFLIGTPPRPVDDGDAFALKRKSGIEKAPGSFFVEISADPDADPDDRRQWKLANPSFPLHTPVEAMLRMRALIPSEDSWMREALGVWDAVDTQQVIDPALWAKREDESSVPSSRFVLGVDAEPLGGSTSVSFAGLRDDGSVHVELDEQRKGTAWVPKHVADLYKSNDISAVVLDAKSPALALVDDMRKLGVRRIVETTSVDMATACEQFHSWATEGGLVHLGQHQLTESLSIARKRSLGDRWAWSRKTTDADITPVVSATLAAWGVKSKKVRGGGGKRSEGKSGGRRVVTW